MGNSNLDRLLRRYIHGQVTEQERIKIEAWLDVKKTKTDFELSKSDEEKLFQKITDNIDNLDEIVEFFPEQGGWRAIYHARWIRVAASILLIMTVSLIVWYSFNGKLKIHETIASHEIEKIILNDGTIVWLHQGSKFSYYEGGGHETTRHAELEGEAFFEVAKDPSRPFTIVCGAMTVKVLGTSFSVKTDKKGIELEVLTGKVNLSSTIDKTGVDVLPTEKVIYSESGKVERLNMNDGDLNVITAKTEYNMLFENTSMDKVLERIEKKFDVNIKVADNRLVKCRITADFTDRSLEKTFQMLAALLEMDYKITGNAIDVSGKGCK